MQIHGFNKTTLLDYPEHLAATIFTGGCNFRCPFCHNASLVINPASQPYIPEDEVLAALKKRRTILEGVCITGGEPTLQKDLPLFIEKIKKLGLNVKLDTNGNHPAMMKYLIQEKLIDYVAMDVKNSRESYGKTIGIENPDLSKICESVDYLLEGHITYEFRTTVVKELHTAADFESIGLWLNGADAYFLQCFEDSGDLITQGMTAWDKESMVRFKDIMEKYVKKAEIRGL
ncbi:anaerobic ribonucleoside-triphosphate reductase activating protein [Anaerolentibacter hominis]|uniref:anaerobic ribonucleoside-triphosphate reductase activating protein n=1 Tax=Anaerolentibacter hominis TaxID=3079009 RepID=UPI0031B85B6B